MKPLFGLTTTKAGVPKRFTLSCGSGWYDTISMATKGSASCRKGVWSLPVDPVLLRRLMPVLDAELTKELQDYLKGLREKQQKISAAIANDSPISPEDRLRGPVQRASVRFLTEGRRVILAHEMGIGKTVIACKALSLISPMRVLIVCPNSVKWSWVTHINDWAEQEHPTLVMESGGRSKEELREKDGGFILYGSREERDNQLSRLIAQHKSYTLILNYEQATMHQKVLCAGTYDVIIVDEAHRAKNRTTQRTQALRKITPLTNYLWLLTGTPIRNNYTDIWSLLNLCDPVRFPSYWNFVNIYLQVTVNYFGGYDIFGPIDPTEFNGMMGQYMFRKTKKEALPELPDKIYEDCILQLLPKQETAYLQMEKKFVLDIKKQLEDGSTIDALLRAPTTIAQLIRLRQICLTPALIGGVEESAKLIALKEIIGDFKETNTKFLIYTNFRAFIPHIEKLFRYSNINYAIIQGGQKSTERAEIESNLRGPRLQGVVGTIAAMGEGMNLQAATVAVFCDRDWVPDANRQAEDRLHRDGIKKSPVILTLYHPNTIEDDIRATCAKKSKLINETVGQVEVVRRMLERW